jgi:hypothetical protein
MFFLLRLLLQCLYSQICWGGLEMKSIGFHFHKKNYFLCWLATPDTILLLFPGLGCCVETTQAVYYVFLLDLFTEYQDDQEAKR